MAKTNEPYHGTVSEDESFYTESGRTTVRNDAYGNIFLLFIVVDLVMSFKLRRADSCVKVHLALESHVICGTCVATKPFKLLL